MSRMGLSAPERARKGAATRIGVTLAEYDAHLAAGERWCCGCQEWHPDSAFHRTHTNCKAARVVAQRRRREAEWWEFRNWLLARVLVK